MGRTSASIRLLTDSTLPDQLWVDPPSATRCESSPCLPTTRLTRASSASERLVGDDDVVETVGDLAGHARPLEGHAGGEVALLDLGEDAQQDLGIDRVG